MKQTAQPLPDLAPDLIPGQVFRLAFRLAFRSALRFAAPRNCLRAVLAAIQMLLGWLLHRAVSPWPRFCRWGLGICLVAALLPVLWIGGLQASGNFHTVIEGELYRAAQPTPAELERWSRDHGIRSVLNLRGPSDQGWYRDEIDSARRLGITHADFAMRASEQLTPARARELIALMQSLPKPLLIHCLSGADRTGLASALYVAASGRGTAWADSQISFRYGHISLPESRAWPMDQSWQAMKRDLPLRLSRRD